VTNQAKLCAVCGAPATEAALDVMVVTDAYNELYEPVYPAKYGCAKHPVHSKTFDSKGNIIGDWGLSNKSVGEKA